jgi:hypothetical protein
LLGKPEGKKFLGGQRHTRGWDQNGSQGDWLRSVQEVQLAQDRDQWWAVVNAVMGSGATELVS